MLLLEASPHEETGDVLTSWPTKPYSNRVCYLSLPSQKYLESLGVWQDITSIRAKTVKNMQISESESDAFIAFGDGQETVGNIVENDVILEALKRNVSSSVEVRYSSSADSYTMPKSVSEKAAIHLHDGSTIYTNLLIGCDGVSSLVRKTMGGQYISWNYNQMGVVATLTLENEIEINSTAWQKFLPDGPIALLPLTDNMSSLVWSTSTTHAKDLLSMDPQNFIDALNNSLWSDKSSSMPPWLHDLQHECTNLVRDVGSMLTPAGSPPSVNFKQLPPVVLSIQEGSRAAFPLGLGHAIHYTAPRVALMGDAAHRVHPLAGQGVNLGFGDVASLTR